MNRQFHGIKSRSSSLRESLPTELCFEYAHITPTTTVDSCWQLGSCQAELSPTLTWLGTRRQYSFYNFLFHLNSFTRQTTESEFKSEELRQNNAFNHSKFHLPTPVQDVEAYGCHLEKQHHRMGRHRLGWGPCWWDIGTVWCSLLSSLGKVDHERD